MAIVPNNNDDATIDARGEKVVVAWDSKKRPSSQRNDEEPPRGIDDGLEGKNVNDVKQEQPIGFIADWMNAYIFISRKLNNHHKTYTA